MISVASDVVCWFLSATLVKIATGKQEVGLQPAARFALTAVLFDYITNAGYRVFITTYALFFAGHLFMDVSMNYVRRVIRWLRNKNMRSRDDCSSESEENEENEESEENEENEGSDEDHPEDYVVRKRRRSPSPRIVRRRSTRLEERCL